MKKHRPRLAKDADIALGVRLAEVRRAKRPLVAQQWIAEEIGCSVNQMHKYETGENRISWSRLLAWCDALNADVIDVIRPLVRKRPSAP